MNKTTILDIRKNDKLGAMSPKDSTSMQIQLLTSGSHHLKVVDDQSYYASGIVSVDGVDFTYESKLEERQRVVLEGKAFVVESIRFPFVRLMDDNSSKSIHVVDILCKLLAGEEF